MRRFLSSLVALPLALAPPAAADAPTRIEETFTRTDGAFISCPGFLVRGDFDVRRTVTTFYDQERVPVRLVAHVHFSGSLTNTVTGTSIADRGNQIVTQDFRSGETTVVGPVSGYAPPFPTMPVM